MRWDGKCFSETREILTFSMKIFQLSVDISDEKPQENVIRVSDTEKKTFTEEWKTRGKIEILF
jgi:hypothetical protein